MTTYQHNVHVALTAVTLYFAIKALSTFLFRVASRQKPKKSVISQEGWPPLPHLSVLREPGDTQTQLLDNGDEMQTARQD